jgi:hypothetical protein
MARALVDVGIDTELGTRINAAFAQMATGMAPVQRRV